MFLLGVLPRSFLRCSRQLQNWACVLNWPHGSSSRLEKNTHFISTFLLLVHCSSLLLLSKLSPVTVQREQLLWQLSFWFFDLQLLIPQKALRTPQESWPHFTSARHSLCLDIKGRKGLMALFCWLLVQGWAKTKIDSKTVKKYKLGK